MSRSSDARRVLQLMRRLTPQGCGRPWRTGTNLAIIEQLLAEHEVDELEHHVRRCAELVATGGEDRQWWYCGNVFGPRTMERWSANYEADGYEADENRSGADANQQNLRAIGQRDDGGVSTPIADLDLRRIIATCKDARAQARSTHHDRSTSDDPQPAHLHTGTDRAD